ncbi:MAG: 1-aminocyclopropane-1-carboxylate deaminase, partial [Clostridia bacterium]|nr:1-aminocyclopropane-1-carboxylate deaminase [Clostridia bacterium]
GTTQAGLVCGQIMAKDDKRKIVGISIARKNPYGGDVVEKSVAEYLDCPQEDIKDYVIFDDNYICGGYGQYDDEIVDTVRNVMINEGIGLNTTYTGKAFSGMKKYLENSGINGKNILFVNTGGTPLFFDDLKVI